MKAQTLQIFVAGHSDELLSRVPDGDAFEAVDLRSLTVAPRFVGNTFAEGAFLVSEEARRVRTDYVGFCSANYDKKFPAPPHLDALPEFARYLRPSDGLGPALATGWLADADDVHPGLTAVLERVASHVGLTVLDRPVPAANTFVCHRDEWFRLLDAFHVMLTAAVDWYGTEPPYRYRCQRCGAVSDTGYGRYTSTRHVGYLGERLTMLHFASRPGIHFVTPRTFQSRTARLLRARPPLLAMVTAQARRVIRPSIASLITPFDGPRCPSCPAQDAPPG